MPWTMVLPQKQEIKNNKIYKPIYQPLAPPKKDFIIFEDGPPEPGYSRTKRQSQAHSTRDRPPSPVRAGVSGHHSTLNLRPRDDWCSPKGLYEREARKRTATRGALHLQAMETSSLQRRCQEQVHTSLPGSQGGTPRDQLRGPVPACSWAWCARSPQGQPDRTAFRAKAQ